MRCATIHGEGRTSMKLWRGGLIGVIAVNALALLAGLLLTLHQGWRSASGIVFTLLALVSLVSAVAIFRRARAKTSSTLRITPLTLVVPIVVFAGVAGTLPLGWPTWAGSPFLSAAITKGALSADKRAAYHLPASTVNLLSGEGISVTIRPSFGEIDYDLDLAPAGLALPGQPTARLLVRPKQGAPREYRFDVPWEDLTMILEAYDTRARQWRGQRSMSADGTSIAIERVAKNRITSMITNAAAGSEPNNPGAQLRTDLHGLMLAYGPTGVIPRSYDWHVYETDEADMCLNTALPNGFRKGGACTTQLPANGQ